MFAAPSVLARCLWDSGFLSTSSLRAVGRSLLVAAGVLALVGVTSPRPAAGQQSTPRTFEAVGAGLTGVGGGSSDWGDFDSDGDLDLVVTGQDANGNQTAAIYENQGGGAFEAVGAGLTDVAFGSSDWGDFDGGGDLDLVVTGRDANGNQTATIYENQGGGGFEPVGAGLTGVQESSSDWGDFDGDGDLDLVVAGQDANGNQTAAIYENQGGGTFEPVGAGLTGVEVGSLGWGDFDSDGDLDLVVAGFASGNSRTAAIYENQGGGAFEAVGAGLTGVFRSSSDWGDFDGDEDLDLVVTGRIAIDDPTATIYENQQSPVAKDDSDQTEEGQSVTTDVLANDSDPDGSLDASTVQVESNPSDGQATANGNGTITYEPNSGFVGTDSYAYTVEDDDGAESNEATVTITVSEPVSISEARSQGSDSRVTIEGTVTRAFGAYVRLQDESGPTGASALVVRQTSGSLSDDFQEDIANGTIQPGTTLRITGTISAFAGLLQINNEDLDTYAVQGQGEPPSLQAVSLADIQAPGGEDYESELIRVEGLTFPSAGGTFQSGTSYTVEDEGGTSFEFRVQDSSQTAVIGEPIPESTFTYKGVLGQFDGFTGNDEGYQFIPVRPSDVQENQPPTADFTFEPNVPEVGETVTFDASGSEDPDGSIVEYRWDFDEDGQTDATGQTVSTSFSTAGTSRSPSLWRTTTEPSPMRRR